MYDLELNADGSCPLYPRLFRGARKIAQSVKIACKTHAGEWLPDRTKGMAFTTWIEQLWRDLQSIGGTIRAELAEVQGVSSVTEFSIRQVGREILVTASLLTDDGEQFGVQVEFAAGPQGNMIPLVYTSFDSKRFLG